MYNSLWWSFLGDPNQEIYNRICNNCGYCVYNANLFDDVPLSGDEVDARHVCWCTDDPDAIEDCILDHLDNPELAIVRFIPPSWPCGRDCNGNGVFDGDDIAEGTSADCNDNDIPDECEIDENSTAPGGPFYCIEECDPDCNTNGIPDECDIDPRDPDGNGTVSEDCQPNGVPDECELGSDCNGNGVPDACDLPDCNTNDIPDECDIELGTSEDCNENGIPDECDIKQGGRTRQQGLPDESIHGSAIRGGLSMICIDPPNLTPEDLVNMLIGPGVTVTNVTFTGANCAVGTFTGGSGIIGFESGIILSSGDIGLVRGPNTYDDTSWDNGLPGDEDLEELIPGFTTYDASVLEFDFTCESGAELQFQYILTSEEYNEWVFQYYNDVFGFFLNGVNIAVVPGTDNTPVSIDNINCGNPYDPPNDGNNCNLFINNDLSDNGGYINTEMDGLTLVFTATESISAGQQNHIKLAIADAGDRVLDSNMFLVANSFTCALPRGACCDESDFTCLDDILEQDCQGSSAVWYAGLECDTLDPPCLAVGACCDTSAYVCEDGVPEDACLVPGEVWHSGRMCDTLDPPCAPPTGACCDTNDYTCLDDIAEDACQGSGMAWDEGLTCDVLDPPCAPPTGACCDWINYACTQAIPEQDCDGSWHPDLTCGELEPPCVPPTGACCDTSDYTCLDAVTEDTCQAPGMEWHEDATCDSLNPPCTPVGACCDTNDYICEDGAPEDACLDSGEVWHPGRMCNELDPPCAPAPTGACCNENDYTCAEDTLQAQCLGSKGVWYEGLTCDSLDPPCVAPPQGACCLPFGGCIDRSEAYCAMLDGVYQGDESTCDEFPCPPVDASQDCNDTGIPDECEAINNGDFDGNGEVALDDFASLAQCMAGPDVVPDAQDPKCIVTCLAAFDFDFDGDVDLQDMRDFQLVFGQAGP